MLSNHGLNKNNDITGTRTAMQKSTIAHKSGSLSETIEAIIKRHLNSLALSEITNLHDMVLEQIEPPLLKAVIEHCRYNQSRAANLLGISRGTCRTKLKKYFDAQYCGHREDTQAK